jgi:hypothetical protein
MHNILLHLTPPSPARSLYTTRGPGSIIASRVSEKSYIAAYVVNATMEIEMVGRRRQNSRSQRRLLSRLLSLVVKACICKRIVIPRGARIFFLSVRRFKSYPRMNQIKICKVCTICTICTICKIIQYMQNMHLNHSYKHSYTHSPMNTHVHMNKIQSMQKKKYANMHIEPFRMFLFKNM